MWVTTYVVHSKGNSTVVFGSWGVHKVWYSLITFSVKIGLVVVVVVVGGGGGGGGAVVVIVVVVVVVIASAAAAAAGLIVLCYLR